MKEFVEECRREWKRLHVPDAIANEMAADLAADLDEAESEGASAEEVLGSGAFDPRSFAAGWAEERGVTQPTAAAVSQPTRRESSRWRLGVLAGLAAAAFVGFILLVGGALAFGRVRSSHGITAPVVRRGPIPPFPNMRVGPFDVHVASVHAPIGAIGLLGFLVFVLLVGSIGLILAVLFWRPWDHSDRWPRRRHDQSPEHHYS